MIEALRHNVAVVVKGIVKIGDSGRRGRGVFIRIMPPGPAQVVVADLVINALAPNPSPLLIVRCPLSVLDYPLTTPHPFFLASLRVNSRQFAVPNP